jgi:hypothetical protein
MMNGDSDLPMTDDDPIFEPGDRVRVHDARSDAWKAGTVQQVIATPGEQVAEDEYVLILSYRVAFDSGGSGRFRPVEMQALE